MEHADSRVMSDKELVAIIKTRAKDCGISWKSIKERVNNALSNAKRTRRIALRSQAQLQALVTRNVADHLAMVNAGLDIESVLFSFLTNGFPNIDDEELKRLASIALAASVTVMVFCS